jgi:phosphoglycerate-specific signal transduction histidine kinase
MSDTVTLEFLAAQNRHILNELSSLRTHIGFMQDDIRVLSAMAMRQDNTTKALIAQIDRFHRDLHQEMQGIREDMRRTQERLGPVEARIQ